MIYDLKTEKLLVTGCGLLVLLEAEDKIKYQSAFAFGFGGQEIKMQSACGG